MRAVTPDEVLSEHDETTVAVYRVAAFLANLMGLVVSLARLPRGKLSTQS